MSFINKYVTPYVGTALVVLVVLFLLNVAGSKSATAKKFTSLFGY